MVETTKRSGYFNIASPQRAPERKVFYVDVGKMTHQRVEQYLENIKNEVKTNYCNNN